MNVFGSGRVASSEDYRKFLKHNKKAAEKLLLATSGPKPTKQPKRKSVNISEQTQSSLTLLGLSDGGVSKNGSYGKPEESKGMYRTRSSSMKLQNASNKYGMNCLVNEPPVRRKSYTKLSSNVNSNQYKDMVPTQRRYRKSIKKS